MICINLNTIHIVHFSDEILSTDQYLLCNFGGDCDSCCSEIPEGDYFWYRTSYEYVEGTYLCRLCATREMYHNEL